MFGDEADIECLFVIVANLASLTIVDPLWSVVSLLFVPRGSSCIESVEMTLSDPSFGLKQPSNIYSKMTFNVEIYYTVSEKSPRLTDKWIRHEFCLNLTLYNLAWSKNGPRMIRRWMWWPFEEATILEFEQERIMK